MKKTITRLFAILLAALLLCGLLPLTVSAEGVDITDKFTDPAFRAAVQELIGKDVILDTDVAGITKLYLNGFYNETVKEAGGIENLAGLEYFPVLEYLNCGTNHLTALPALPVNLIELTCYRNQLTALPTLPSGLLTLACGENRLTVLPTLPTGLKTLECFDNQLTALPTLPSSLTYLDCAFNQLTSLDLTGLQLKHFACVYNNMASRHAIKGYSGSIWSINIYPQNPVRFWSTWHPWFIWILEIVLFGWLWMRWL